MNVAQHILIGSIHVYRVTLSPAQKLFFGPLAGCRFTPTCSQYALEAIQMHGAIKGTFLTLHRLCRCHPWGGCGDDPVPPQSNACATVRLFNLKSPHSHFKA